MERAPKFPYPFDHRLGQISTNEKIHSGYYGEKAAEFVRIWQRQMRKRGWHINVDGRFGAQSAKVCSAFQREKGLPVTGTVGPRAWELAWTAPINHPSHHDSPHPDSSSKPWREKVANWHERHVGITESPAGSNCDTRADGIRAAQDGCANGTWLRHQPWCGVWVWGGLHAAGLVKRGASFLASVAAIEDYARAHKGPFRGWTTDGSQVKKGDIVVLFDRGVHVGTVRAIDSNYVYTWEGNTSSGSSGSQSNGGGAFRRSRARRTDVHGYALVRGD